MITCKNTSFPTILEICRKCSNYSKINNQHFCKVGEHSYKALLYYRTNSTIRPCVFLEKCPLGEWRVK